MKNVDIKNILSCGISPYFTRIYQPIVEEAEKEYAAFSTNSNDDKLSAFFKEQINKNKEAFLQLKNDLLNRENSYYACSDPNKRKSILLDFCKFLNNGKLDEEDKKAMDRWLDFEAVSERSKFLQSGFERKTQFYLQQMRYLSPNNPDMFDFLLGVTENYQGDERVTETV